MEVLPVENAIAPELVSGLLALVLVLRRIPPSPRPQIGIRADELESITRPLLLLQRAYPSRPVLSIVSVSHISVLPVPDEDIAERPLRIK